MIIQGDSLEELKKSHCRKGHATYEETYSTEAEAKAGHERIKNVYAAIQEEDV